jgi:hypothetical protein
MITKLSNLAVLLVAAELIAGCGTNVELQRSDTSLRGDLSTSKFFVSVDDGSKNIPENWDSRLSHKWTDDEKRANAVVENIAYLKEELGKRGFEIVENREDCTVLANLGINSVRYDPLAGWITDDAQIEYVASETGDSFGIVQTDKVWITTTFKVVIDALVKGSVELWSPEISE